MTITYGSNPPPPFPVLINPAAASGTLTLSATPLIPVIIAGTVTAGALTSGTILISDSTPIPLPASANLEGTVNGSDFSILAANFGTGLTNWDEGNFLYGSSVDGSDFSALAANFGQGSTTLIAAAPAPVAASTDGFIVTVGSPSPAASQVPEPVSAAIVLCGMGILGMRKKNKSQKSLISRP